MCVLDVHKEWGFKKWISALRAEIIRVKCNTVIIYFEQVQKYDDVPPIKNSLQTMCQIIRQHNKGSRIFIANLLPQVSFSPMEKPLPEINFTLLQAVRSVNRALGKVHFLSIHEHFVSRKGHIIRPTHKFFTGSDLSTLGCMVFRKCLMREVGIKSYWFK